MHLGICDWHLKVEYSHFQQFLHYKIPEFILVLYTVVIKCSTLKQQLIINFVLELFCKSQILIQITAKSKLFEVLMMQSLNVMI